MVDDDGRELDAIHILDQLIMVYAKVTREIAQPRFKPRPYRKSEPSGPFPRRAIPRCNEIGRRRKDLQSESSLAGLKTLANAYELVEGELLSRSFYEFVKAAWEVVEPGRQFSDNWHVKVLCQYLQACAEGIIKRLVVNIPPRFAKSTIISVLFPAWVWTRHSSSAMNAGTRFLTASYSADLATRDAVATRRLMKSDWYQRRFGHKWRFAGDQNVKTRYENTKRGYRVITSPEGGGTGEGGDVEIIDDPISAKDANSEQVCLKATQWLKETMQTRFNDPRTGVQIIIMQRFSEADPSAWALSTGKYVHLCFPMRYEVTKTPPQAEYHPANDPIGYVDPRTEEGELLHPERFDEEITKEYEEILGSYGVAGQFQQRPTPRGGGVLKSDWLKRYKVLPNIVKRKIYVDTASKTKERNDFSVFQLWGLGEDGKIYLLDQLRGKWEAHDLKKRAIEFWNKHLEYDQFLGAPLQKMIVEDTSAGTGLIQDLGNDGGIPIEGIQRTKDKLTRAYDGQPHMEAGHVFIPEDAPWLFDFCAEIDKFTKDDTHQHDDQIDPMLDAISDLLSRRRTLFEVI